MTAANLYEPGTHPGVHFPHAWVGHERSTGVRVGSWPYALPARWCSGMAAWRRVSVGGYWFPLQMLRTDTSLHWRAADVEAGATELAGDAAVLV